MKFPLRAMVITVVWLAGAVPAASSADPGKALATNEAQRSVAIYNYKTTAPSGWQRGEEIYYFKCSMCHNKYTIKAGSLAPQLAYLYKRPKLLAT
jgi:cytochrome c5